jgi:hypothetical protein
MALALSDYPELARYMDEPGRDPRDAMSLRPMRRGLLPELPAELQQASEPHVRPAIGHGPAEVEAER